MLFSNPHFPGTVDSSADDIALLQRKTSPIDLSTEGRSHTYQWPPSKPLIKSSVTVFFEVVIGLGMVIPPLYFLSLAILVASRHGRPVDDQWASHLQQTLKYSSTAFTMLFAAIAGRGTRSFSRWQLERGISLGLLERLMGSSTVLSTIITQFQLRSLNLLGLSLIVLWTLSPVGSQSFLRVFSIEIISIPTGITLDYFDTNQVSKIARNLDPAIFSEAYEAPIDAIYMSALLAPFSVHNSSVDLWGNVKVPNFRYLEASLSTSTGWSEAVQKEPVYSSLLGIPMQLPGEALDSTGNSTFAMETSYLNLDCYKSTTVNYGTGYATGYIIGSNNSAFSVAISNNSILQVPQDVDETLTNYQDSWSTETSSRTLLLQSKNWQPQATGLDNTFAVFCNLTQSYVESTISCPFQKSCLVTKMRESQLPHPPANISVLSLPNFFLLLQQYFPLSSGPAGPTNINNGVGDLPNSSYTELYIDNPYSIFRQEGVVNYSNISLKDLSIRIGQVLNTYYIASLSPFTMTGNLTSVPTSLISANGTLSTPSPQYVCNWPILALLLISTLVMLVAAIAGIVFERLAVGPDILGYCSTLTRDNPHLRLPEGGSMLYGDERTRLLMDLRLRLGDVRGVEGGGEGYIAVGPERKTVRLRKGMRYS